MKSFKEHRISLAEITDIELSAYVTNVVIGEDGYPESYDLDLKLEDGSKTKSIKNPALKKAIVNHIGEESILQGFDIQDSLVYCAEVYDGGKKGYYIELDEKKIHFKKR